MFRWRIVCTVGALALAFTQARAQVPSAGSTGLKYQVVSPSTSPLSAPIPSVGTFQKKSSYFGRFYDTLAKYLPFVPARKPTIAPQMPTNQKLATQQGPGVQVQQTGGGIPIPQIPPLIQGTAR